MAYVGRQNVTGEFIKLDAIPQAASNTFNLQRNGAAFAPGTTNQCIVSVNGVTQAPGDAFNISGSQIVFTETLSASDVIDYILVMGSALSAGVPSDGSVSTAKLANNSVDLASKVTGILPVANGGTGIATFKAEKGTYLQTGNSYVSPTNNDTWSDFYNVNVSITPSSTNSKILILTNAIGYGRSNNWVGFRLLRDSTVINTQWTYIDDPSYWSQASCNIVDLDSPNTTSSITYKIQMYADTNYGSLRMQHGGALINSDATSGTRSTIVALEVAR